MYPSVNMTLPFLDPCESEISPLIVCSLPYDRSGVDVCSMYPMDQTLSLNPFSNLGYPYMFYVPSDMPSMSASTSGSKRPLQPYSAGRPIDSACNFDTNTVYSKRTKLEHNLEPSKVLHVRNIDYQAQECDLTLLAVPFGKMKSMLYARKTNQALIEMSNEAEASAMVDFYSQYPATFNCKEMVIQYSTHQSLELKLNNISVDASVETANKMVSEYRLRAKELQSKRKILRVVIEEFGARSINHLIMLKVFQRFGKVLRIIIFSRNTQCQCLIEMGSHVSAHAALLQLNGRSIFADSCHLKVEFSKNCDSLQIQRQNARCRDYVVTPLSVEESVLLESISAMPNITFNSTYNLFFVKSKLSSDRKRSYYRDYPVTLDIPFMPAPFDNIYGHRLVVPEAGNPTPYPGILAGARTSVVEEGSSTIKVTNINMQKVRIDALFTLFGVYGDVTRVTLSQDQGGYALIHMSHGIQADTACRLLNDMPLCGRNIQAVVVADQEISQYEHYGEASLNSDVRDFSHSPLHRFKKPNSKNHFNIFPPSPVLHLSNIPLTMFEEDLLALFLKHGFNYIDLKMFQKEKKMALARMASLEVAIAALIALHNCKLNDSSHLRVSFSKAVI